MRGLVRNRGLCCLVAYALIMCDVGSASAGNCGYVSHGTYQQQYQTPYYQTPYVSVIAQAIPYYVPFQSFTSVGDDARGYYTTKDAVKAGTLEALREFALQASVGPGQPQTQPPGPGGPPAGAAAAPNVPRAWKQVARQMFDAKCVKCHKPNTERLDLTMDIGKFDSKRYSSAGEQWTDVLTRVMAGADAPEFMPPPGPRIAGEELDAVQVGTREFLALARSNAKAPPTVEHQPKKTIPPAKEPDKK